VARLYSIAVCAGNRGSGVGRRLVEAAEMEAARRECDTVRLEIRADNSASISFFERLGYHRTGTADGYYEDGMNAFRYQKKMDTIGPSGVVA
jgi:ribosomal protein S18 acetylase RimI-like enzyme